MQALLATADDSDSCSQPGISHARWRQLMPTTEGQVAPKLSALTSHLVSVRALPAYRRLCCAKPARRLGDAPGKNATAM